MNDVKEMTDAELYQAIAEKYGENWNLDFLRKQRPIDELIIEFFERWFRDVKD